MKCVLIHSRNAQYRHPAKYQNKTWKSKKPIYNHLKGWATLATREPSKYELNSQIPFLVHQILFEVSSNYLTINDQIMPVNGFLKHQVQWPKQVFSKAFTSNFKTKGISFYHLKILHRMVQETLNSRWPSNKFH